MPAHRERTRGFRVFGVARWRMLGPLLKLLSLFLFFCLSFQPQTRKVVLGWLLKIASEYLSSRFARRQGFGKW